jgi:hypothetical protein
MKREPGFYHIRTADEWIIARWIDTGLKSVDTNERILEWIIPGSRERFSDQFFYEIDERQIIRQPE